MHPTDEHLSRTLERVMADYLLQRYSGPGNPMGTHILRIGDAVATKVPFLKQNELMNSVHHLDDAGLLARILSFYAETEQPCWVVVPPYASVAITDALIATGFRVERYASSLVAQNLHHPAANTADVRLIDREDLDVFLDTINLGFGQDAALLPGLRRNQSFWCDVPNWYLFLARVDGVPAGAAVLSTHGDVGYLAAGSVLPEFRRCGVQAALIAARIQCAIAQSCAVVASGAEWASQSQRNLQRAGLAIAHVKAIWTNRGGFTS